MYCTFLPLFAALLLAVLPVSTLAADSLAVPIRPHGLQPGNRAVLFEIDGLLQVRAFEGMGIAFKQQHSRSRATRITLKVEYGSSRGLTVQDDWVSELIQEENRYDQFNSTRSLDADLLRLAYRDDAQIVHTYWGWGPTLSVARTESNYDTYMVEVGQVSQNVHTRVQNRLAGGLKSILGVEWFATRAISLHAEYGLTLVRSRSWSDDTRHTTTYSNDDVSTDTYETEWNSLELEPIPVVFGLSVYF